jgi:hypothetical protein
MIITYEVSLWGMWERAFMALTLWREARGEPFEARVAVAGTVMNRVDRPSWWGRDVISVLRKKWQYSSLTDPKDRQLTKWPEATDAIMEECLFIAHHVIGRTGSINGPLRGADSYFDISIPAPYWTKGARFCGQIGRLKFYDVDRDWEEEDTPPIKETEA